MKIDITEATATQLAEYATVHLGLPNVRHTMGRDKIIALMAQTGFNQTTIDVDAPEPMKVGAANDAAPAAEKRKMVTIMISVQELPGSEGKEPVPVGVNGKVMLIERGKPQTVPVEYVEALRNAVKLSPIVDDNGKLIGMTPVPTYPFSTLSQAA